ncbi:ATP-binding cassette transporter, putative [Ricinus communis]|uniref:ATP-binding cassette transporter, putative n=1 Tax=Ricinus communis TaxID=3988 RepID=B9RZZ3_RICCO|nr:ATP-binding cassette transporter, putative [Ricinus communis]
MQRFVEEVIEAIELEDIRDSLVGIPGQSGLSTEKRKGLTIVVELVSNPSIIFMDEPTSGLDARESAIVLRAEKNVVATGRTIVCTILQPSIDVFEAFDELILVKGEDRLFILECLVTIQSIPGVSKIKNNYNPATWMLEVTSAAMEEKLGLDFGRIYKGSPEYHWVQFMACLWKQRLSYWRSPEYNVVRFIFMIVASLIFAIVSWQKGQKIGTEQDLINILGSTYIAVIFLGINNCSTVLPYVATERTVLYREKFAGVYSAWAYSFAQVTIEFLT